MSGTDGDADEVQVQGEVNNLLQVLESHKRVDSSTGQELPVSTPSD